jgi:hypothetical protein
MSYPTERRMCGKLRRETREGSNRERLSKNMYSVMNQRRGNMKG